MKLSLVALILFLSHSSFAENKHYEDEIFNEPQGKASYQIVLGAVDGALAMTLFQSATKPTNLEMAEGELEHALHLMTREERESKVLDLKGRIGELRAVNAERFAFDIAVLEDEIQGLLANSQIVPASEKAQSLRMAELKLSFERELVLKSSSTFSTAVKFTKAFGGVLFIVDGSYRLYVWKAKEANPTFTPVGTLAWKSFERALSKR